MPSIPAIHRRHLNASLLALATTALAGSGAALAQKIKSAKIIAPAGPGGGYDQLARATQEVLQGQKLVPSVQVTNVPGAGGTIGLAQFVNAKERDPSLLVAGLGLVGAVIVNKAPVSLEQAAPMARLTGEFQPLVVAANSPIRTLEDLIRKFKENPGSVSWGGFALGSPDHILSGLTVKAIGGDVKTMNYIPVGAGGEMLPLVISGKVTVATGGLNEFAGQIAAGKLRAIAVSSPERIKGVDIPTFREQGADVTLVNWRGLMAPQGLGAEDRAALAEALGAMVKSDAWSKIVADREWIDMYLDSAAFGAFLKEEQTRIGAILKETGLVPA